MLKLNLGCGKAHYDGFINIDTEESVNPDVLCDFRKSLPYADKSVDSILLIHTIEHIEDRYHFDMLMEFNRVLRIGGGLTIAYPEFSKCAMNFVNNYRGQREFWKRTIYGRQLYKSDYHVALMDSDEFRLLLQETGFRNIYIKPEPSPEEHNTIVICQKSNIPVIGKEQVLQSELFGVA